MASSGFTLKLRLWTMKMAINPEVTMWVGWNASFRPDPLATDIYGKISLSQTRYHVVVVAKQAFPCFMIACIIEAFHMWMAPFKGPFKL